MSSKHLIPIYRDVAERLEDLGYEADVREHYSGQGMYGDTTVGIVTDAFSTLVGAMVAISMQEAEENWNSLDILECIPNLSDNMGRVRMIYYRR